MARGKRASLFAQAVLVWGVGKIDARRWIEDGELGKGQPRRMRMNPELRRRVDEIQAYMNTHDGKLPPELLTQG